MPANDERVEEIPNVKNTQHLSLDRLSMFDEMVKDAENKSKDKLIFTPYTFDELLSMPPKEWLLDEFFGEEDLGMIYGLPGCGKTFFVIEMIIALCTAKFLANRFAVKRPLNVAYCAGEGISGLPSRFQAAAQHHGVVEMPSFTFYKTMPQLYMNSGDSDITTIPRQFVQRIQEPTKPLIAQNPPIIWIEKATVFTEWCHANLIKNPDAFKKMQERGFTTESIEKYKIGFNPGNRQGRDFKRSRQDWGLEERIKDDGTHQKIWLPIGFTIPTFSDDGQVVKLKIRRSAWKEDDNLPKYVEVSGSKSSPSVFGNTQLPVGLVLESEFDGLLIQQETGDLLYCVALGGSTKSIDAHTDALLRATKHILFLPDFDQAGAVAWVKWKRLFPRIHRILTPTGKSAGDAFIEGINLREWIESEITNSNKT